MMRQILLAAAIAGLGAGLDAAPARSQVDSGLGDISPRTLFKKAVHQVQDNPEAAMVFLNWVASSEFSNIFANELPGFFPLSNAAVTLEDPLAQEFISWRDKCESSIRSTYQILSRGTPNLENETWNASVAVIKGDETPEEAGQRLQDGLATWYEPQQ